MSNVRVPEPHEVNAVLHMLTRAYVAARADFPDDVRELGRYSEFDPDGGPENWVVIWEGPRPVSALRLFYREVEIANVAVPVAGIGNVGTDPECGGRGLGRAVMEAAHHRLAEESVPVVLLVTDIPAFYARLGYEVVEQPELRGPLLPTDETPGDDAGTRLNADTATPSWAHDLHARLATATGGRFLRSAHYWERWIDGFRAADPIERWLLTDRAYLIGRREESGAAFRVLEAAGPADALEALITTAAGSAATIKSPDDGACREPVVRLTSALERRTRRGIMARPIVPDAPGAGAFAGFLELDTF